MRMVIGSVEVPVTNTAFTPGHECAVCHAQLISPGMVIVEKRTGHRYYLCRDRHDLEAFLGSLVVAP